MKISESGRSMVEMLGVLAVIGVLSIGGIAGYMVAMNRHHSNNVLEGVSARAVIISAQKMMGQPAAHPADMAEEIDDYAVAVVDEPGVCAECFGIEVSGIPQGVCRYVLNQKWATPEGVYLNDDEYPTEDGTNCDKEDKVIEFVFSPSMGGESHTCGYCQHDENGTCVADDTCENGCPGYTPMKANDDRCYHCRWSSLVTSAEECTACSNRFLTLAGNCVPCDTSGSAAADASECARCPIRSMRNGKCVRDRCPDGQFAGSSGTCVSCSMSFDWSASKKECAKCSNRFRDRAGYCHICSTSSAPTTDASECAKCPNRSMQDGLCVRDRCPDGQWMSSAGDCYNCSHNNAPAASETECAKCSNRFLTLEGTCALCNTSGSVAVDVSECAKCPNRSMQDGKCVLDRCPDGQWMTIVGNCYDCSYSSAYVADASKCAKCPEREMYNGKWCALKECPAGTIRQSSNGECLLN